MLLASLPHGQKNKNSLQYSSFLGHDFPPPLIKGFVQFLLFSSTSYEGPKMSNLQSHNWHFPFQFSDFSHFDLVSEVLILLFTTHTLQI